MVIKSMAAITTNPSGIPAPSVLPTTTVGNKETVHLQIFGEGSEYSGKIRVSDIKNLAKICFPNYTVPTGIETITFYKNASLVPKEANELTNLRIIAKNEATFCLFLRNLPASELPIQAAKPSGTSLPAASKPITGPQSTTPLPSNPPLPSLPTNETALTTPLIDQEPPVKETPKPVWRYVAATLHFLLVALTIPILLINLVLIAVVQFLLMPIIKTIICLFKKNRLENIKESWNWFEIGKWYFNVSSKIVSKSFSIAKKALDTNTPGSEIRNDLLNLTIDFNGELRNSLSVCNAVGVISGTTLGFVLGPLRIFQGLLIVIVTIFGIIDASKNLKLATTEAEKAKLKADLIMNVNYLIQGILWIALGALQLAISITSVMSSGVVPLVLTLIYLIVMLILFDGTFISVSACWIYQSIVFNNQYLKPFEAKLNECRDVIGKGGVTAAEVLAAYKALYNFGYKNMLDAYNDREAQSRETMLKRIITEENLKSLKEKIQQMQNPNVSLSADCKVEPTSLLDSMEIDLKKKKFFWLIMNIGLSAISQIGITLTGTAFDLASVVNVNADTGFFVNLMNDFAWIFNNTLSKLGDNSKIQGALVDNHGDNVNVKCKKHHTRDFILAGSLMLVLVAAIGNIVGGALGQIQLG